MRACPERTILHGSTKCDENTEEYRSGVDRFLLFLSFPAHACPFGYAPDVTAKGTAPPLFSIDGSQIEQRGYKKVHWEKRDSAGEMKRIGSTMVETSVLFLVASVSSLE